MAISLESIYKPVNDFFFDKFKHNEGAPVEFRMEQSATVITQQDFSPPQNPEEEFSDLVNTIPYVDENGINVSFLMNNIDDTYEPIILSALPFVPDDFDETEKESITEGFVSAKNKAKRDWENAQKVRGGGIADSFSFSDALPTNWYDENAKIWEKWAYEIKEPQTKSDKSDTQILKIRMTDTQIANILPMLKKPTTIKAVDLSKHVIAARQFQFHKAVKPSLKIVKPVSTTIKHSAVMAVRSQPAIKTAKPISTGISRGIQMKGVSNTMVIKKPTKVKKTALGAKFSSAFHSLKLSQKIFVKNYVKEKSPTKEVKTNGVSVSFEYCVVNIRRPWFNEVLCNINRAWYIPGFAKGALNDSGIGAMSYLPIAFVAVKNLNISANWLETDKKELEKATSFGPFDINGHDIHESGSLSHDGIQIIGWMLQKLPTLPPNEKI